MVAKSDPDEVRRIILECGSRIFRVVFEKRMTGERRSMTCKMGVKKGVNKELAYDPRLAEQDAANDLIRVYDVELGRAHPDEPEKCYRFISLDRVISLKCGALQYPGRRKR